MVLVAPNMLTLIAFAVLAASIEVQVRVVEEPSLLRLQGQAYRAYVAAAGRVVPHVG